MSRKVARREERSRSLGRRILAGATTAFLALGMTVGGAGAAVATSNIQNTPHWENYYETQLGLAAGSVDCVKYDGPISNEIGTVNGDTVTLKVNANMVGLIVKGGDEGGEEGNVAYDNPKVGVAYSTPTYLDNKGEPTTNDVSHWIVCYGPTSVTPSFSVTPQTCPDGSLVGGSIVLGSTVGITYVVRDSSNAVVTVLTNLAPGTYTVTATASSLAYTLNLTNPAYSTSAVVAGFEGTCGSTTPTSVTPSFTVTPQTCPTDSLVGGSIVLGSTVGITYEVRDSSNAVVTVLTNLAPGTYTVTATASSSDYTLNLTDPAYSTSAVIGAFTDACGDLPDLPVTNAFLAFESPKCEVGQKLDPTNFIFDAELAKVESSSVDEDGNYTVVFTAIGEKTVFDQSPDVTMDGRTVSNGGKTLTFVGQLVGPSLSLCFEFPSLANWPASATASNQVCEPLGLVSGAITVQFSVGPEGNLNPVRYYINYGTPAQQELTSAVTNVAPGTYTVTAVTVDPADSINDSGNMAEFDVVVGVAAEQTCDLDTLAFTGAGEFANWLGFAAVLITLAGMGLVARRHRVEA